MQAKLKQDQMNELEPVGFMVRKEQNKINKRAIDLQLLDEQQKPSISVKQAELKIFDTDYTEVHEKQEAYQQVKNDKMRTFEFPRIHTRVLQSSYCIQEQVVLEIFDLGTIYEIINHYHEQANFKTV